MVKQYRIIIWLILSALASFYAVRVGQADSKEEELLKIKARIAIEKEKLREVQAEERGILKRLNSIERQIYETEKNINRLRNELLKVKGAIQTSEAELKGLESSLRDYRQRLQNRLRVMYRAGRLGHLGVILTSSNFADFLRRIYFMKLVARKDVDLIQQVKEQMKAIEAKQNELQDKQRELERLKRSEEVVKKLRESQRQDRLRLLAKVRQNKAIYISKIKELEEASRAIRRLITRLQKNIFRSPSPKLLDPKLLGLKRRLVWPVDGGKILREYGLYYHPKFGTEVINKGIDIGAPYGQPVRSVLDGKVVYADYFKGYGRLAMVDHGSGLYSLYAYLSEFLIKNGQRVNQGDLIGRVGDSGPSGEPSLHFELRINGESVDPLEWLGKR